ARRAGEAALRDRTRRLRDRPCSAALAPLPPDVLVGVRQARQRRSQLARADRPAGPLPDTAPSTVDGLVHAPAAPVVPELLGGLSLLRRAGRAVSLLCAAQAPTDRVRSDLLPAADDRPDRELRVLQPARRGSRGPAPGRP